MSVKPIAIGLDWFIKEAYTDTVHQLIHIWIESEGNPPDLIDLTIPESTFMRICYEKDQRELTGEKPYPPEFLTPKP